MSESLQKILGINTSFSDINYKGLSNDIFGSMTSFMDYDAVLIDTSYIADGYEADKQSPFEGRRLLSKDSSAKIKRDFYRTKNQIIELLKQGKNVFVLMATNPKCFIHTGKTEYSGTGRNARGTNIVEIFDVFSFLPIEIKPTLVTGEKFNIVCNPPYSTFFQSVKNYVYYDAYFETSTNQALLTIPNTNKSISAVFEYENGKIIILPYPYTEENFNTEKDWKKFAKNYLDALCELNAALKACKTFYTLPSWTENVKILNEQEEEFKLAKEYKKLQSLEKRIEKQEENIRLIKQKKILLSATGTVLEEVVKETLQEIGFILRDTILGRSDVVASYKDISIVAEIKGVSKSAAEKHAAQLEKWVSQFIEENEKVPKPLLIVNGYCETPLMTRSQEIFPKQMLQYCESRGHALITTTQLLCLYIEIMNNPICAEERIAELLSCVGKYQRYMDFENYLQLIKSEEI